MLGEQGFYPQEKMPQRGWGRGELTLQSEGDDVLHLYVPWVPCMSGAHRKAPKPATGARLLLTGPRH